MKITLYKGTREESFHRAMAELYHHHVVKCLSSFVYSSKFYMIYEKADGNVEEFMVRHRHPSKLADFSSRDLAQQMFGLASGLSFVHNQGRAGSDCNPNLLAVPTDGPQETAYLHDIKPENLLMFTYDQEGRKTYWFRLSDFSCAKVVDLVASVSGQHRLSWRSTGKSGTPIYRAPETADTGQSSRPYDLWSLGCVFLELLVWYLDGYEALEHFRKSRECHISPKGHEDEGFYFTQDEAKPKRYQVRPAVVDKMRDMSARCTGPLKRIADTIPTLLQIDPKLRPTAHHLVASLRDIDSGAKPPIEITSSKHTSSAQRPTGHVPSSPSLPVYSSDSDSDFPGLIRVERPTNERSSP